MNDVHRVVLEIEVMTPRAEFVDTWRRMADAAAAAPGNISQSLNTDAGDPTHYFIVSEWASAASFQEFSASPAHSGLATALRSCGRTVSMARMHHVASGPVRASSESGDTS
jgi:heme-degrading monooxygenase HmoA